MINSVKILATWSSGVNEQFGLGQSLKTHVTEADEKT